MSRNGRVTMRLTDLEESSADAERRPREAGARSTVHTHVVVGVTVAYAAKRLHSHVRGAVSR